MTQRIKRYLNWIAFMSLVLCLSSCGLSGSAQTGEVLDEATEKPIEGAIVVAEWIGDVSANWADSHSTCYHVATTTTDDDGEYRIPSWSMKKEDKRDWHKNLTPRDVQVSVYKAGYVMSDKSFTSGSYEKGVYYLKPFEGSVAERLEYLLSAAVSCGSEYDRILVDYYQTLYSEAKSIAVTKDEKLKAYVLLVEVEKQSLGSTQAWRNYEQRKQELR